MLTLEVAMIQLKVADRVTFVADFIEYLQVFPFQMKTFCF